MIVIVNYVFDGRDHDVEALLARYRWLGGWAGAVAHAAGQPIFVVQRFRLDRALSRDGVEYRFVADGETPSPPPWYFSPRIANAVRFLKPSVVHANGMVFPTQIRMLRAWLGHRAALLVQDHGGIHAGSPGFRRLRWRLLHRLGLRAADGFLFSSGALAEPWLQAGIIAPEQTIYEIMESGTDLGAQAARPGDHTALGRPAVLWVGRLDRNKDPLTVLNAFERVVERLAAAALTMVFTEGDLLPEVERRAQSGALRGRVHLLGRVERAALPALYSTADLFVLGSHHEGSGYALIEALSFGVTPVVTDIPSFRSLTDGGKLGALFPVGDTDALGRALEQLGGSDFTARRAAVRAYFERELSWPAIGRRALSIYRAAAERARV